MIHIMTFPVFPPIFVCFIIISVASETGQYQTLGAMVAVCLVQAGAASPFLSERIFRLLALLPNPPPGLEDIMEDTFWDALKKVQFNENFFNITV